MGAVENLRSVINDGQDNVNLTSINAPRAQSGSTYEQRIKSIIQTKSAPDSLANEIRTKANTEAVIMILDKSGGIKHITNKFFLSNMQMSMREKFQLMETFGAANVSFFGEAARVYSFQAKTIDAPSQETGVSQGKYYYQSSILKMYNEVLRASQLIKDDKIAVIKTCNHLIRGYPLNLQVAYNAANDPVTGFNLQFIVTEHSLEIPDVISEEYLQSMYSTEAHITSQAILTFVNNIDSINKKIDKVLATSAEDEAGSIKNIETSSFSHFNTDSLANVKTAYISQLSANAGALRSEFGSVLDGETSPLVYSKFPMKSFDKLLAVIPSMFADEEVFNSICTDLRTLQILKAELIHFKVYRLNVYSGGKATSKKITDQRGAEFMDRPTLS